MLAAWRQLSRTYECISAQESNRATPCAGDRWDEESCSLHSAQLHNCLTWPSHRQLFSSKRLHYVDILSNRYAMLTRTLKEFQWRLGSLRHVVPASGVQRVRHDILGRSGPCQVRTSPEIFRRNYLSYSRRQTSVHSGNRMFSTNSVHPDSSDVSVFIGSEDLPGSTSLSDSKPVYAGTAAGANATGPPTAVYLNPAHQAHLKADSTSVATKVLTDIDSSADSTIKGM